MADLKWHRTTEGQEATGEHGTYEARRTPKGLFLAVLDTADEWGEPGTLRSVKDRCQALEDDRAERHARAGGDLPAPYQPTLSVLYPQSL